MKKIEIVGGNPGSEGYWLYQGGVIDGPFETKEEAQEELNNILAENIQIFTINAKKFRK